MANRRSAGTSALIIGLVIVVLFAFFVPAVITAQDSSTTNSFTQPTDTLTPIKPPLYAHIEIEPNDDINVTLIDKKSGISANSSILSVGDTETLTVGSYDVTVTYDIRLASDRVGMTYTYPTYVGWPAGIRFIVENVVLFMLALAVLLIAALVIAAIWLGDSS